MKNNKSEKNKNVRGFYVALGISALMIGSACYFSYKEGDNKYAELSSVSEISQYAVDRKETNIPKVTTSSHHQVYSIFSTETTTTTSATTITTTTAEEIETIKEEIITEETQEITSENIQKPNQPLNSLNIINEFSGQELVKNVTTGSWQTHNGTDYKAEIGDNVFSVTDGQVTAVDNDPLWGTTVVIQASNGDIWRYCNLAKDLSVQKGISISAGDIIGSVGDTADIESALEPHLHIEILRGGKYLNPADFIN